MLIRIKQINFDEKMQLLKQKFFFWLQFVLTRKYSTILNNVYLIVLHPRSICKPQFGRLVACWVQFFDFFFFVEFLCSIDQVVHLLFADLLGKELLFPTCPSDRPSTYLTTSRYTRPPPRLDIPLQPRARFATP